MSGLNAMPPKPHPRAGKQQIAVVSASYGYSAQRSDELSINEGDILYVLSKEDPDWWLCKSGDKQGLIPSNYVDSNTTQIDNPLHEAAKRGNTSFVHELLSTGISPNDKAGNAPIHWACRAGHEDVTRMLLDKHAELNPQLGDTPLHLAAWGGHEGCANLLLNHSDIDTKLKNSNQETALQLAKTTKVASLIANHIGDISASRMLETDEDE